MTALFIGDSYTEGYKASSSGKRWSRVLADANGWAEVNEGVGGSGFTVAGSSSAVPGGRTFLQQAQHAASVGVVPDVVIVAGGRNDSTTNVIAAAHAFVDYVRYTWPAARLVAVPGLWDASAPPRYLLDRMWDWRTVFLARGVELIGHAWSWLFGHPEQVDGDKVHPNDAGYATIANYVLQGLTGNDTRVHSGDFAVTAWAPDGGRQYKTTDAVGAVIDGVFHLSGGFERVGGNIDYPDWFAKVPAWCAPGHARFFPVYTAGGNGPLLAKADVNGVLSIAAIDRAEPVNQQLLIPATSWPVGR